MRMQTDLIEQAPDGIWMKDSEGEKVDYFDIEIARQRAEDRLREIAKREDISEDWHASVKLDGEHIAEIEI